jgi:outer membrane protein assembly factor BamB
MHKFVIIPFQKKSIIRCIDLEEGQEEWTVDISEIGRRILPSGKVELGKVHSPKVKLYENIAVIPILSWGTIGIDINTGDILWQLSHPSTYINYQYGQYLYTVGDNIIEFDAKSGLVLRSKPITDILDMLNLDIKSATRAVQGVSVSEKYIIYGNRGYVWIISRSTLELIETVEIEAQGSVYSGSPLYHEGMLYIVDGFGHLHVIQDEVY